MQRFRKPAGRGGCPVFLWLWKNVRSP